MKESSIMFVFTYKILQFNIIIIIIQCAKRCLEEMSFICRGFDYEAEEENCILYNVNAGMVGLTSSQHLQFYQLLSQAGKSFF